MKEPLESHDSAVRRRAVTSALLLVGMILVSAGGVPGCGSERPDEPANQEAVPHAGIPFMLNAFDSFPVVAFGEAHGLEEQHAFIHTLLAHPDFSRHVRFVVVEFGNALYQDVLDRYLAGEDVAEDELQKVWRNTTQSLNFAWEEPVYKQFFVKVRALNQTLPEAQRLRVLAGDPPINWPELKGADAYQRFQAQRDTFLAQMVIEQVLERGERALLIAGVGHVMRDPPRPGIAPVISAIEKRFPGSTFVIHPLTGAEAGVQDVAQRLAGWPVPSISVIQDTWLGQLDASLGIGIVKVTARPGGGPGTPRPRPLPDTGNHDAEPREESGEDAGVVMAIPLGDASEGGRAEETVLFEGEGVVKQDIADALLYLGPPQLHTFSTVPEALYEEEAYWEALNRRHRIVFGIPLDPRIRLTRSLGMSHDD